MDWNKNKSIVLSRVCTIVFGILGVIVAITLPSLVDRYLSSISAYKGMRMDILVPAYTLMIPFYIILFQLYRLLSNISLGKVYTGVNVKRLRRLSWACFMASWIGLMASIAFIPYIVIFVGAGFMGLILRVVKNVLAEAVHLKDENDYTI